MDEELFNIQLPKWSFMQVKGDPVSPAQAGDIILFTNLVNYDHLLARFFEPLGLLSFENERIPFSIYFIGSNRNDPIYYLRNNRIPSFQMGGWCDWDGSIHANSYNLGKSPDVDSIYEEWEVIAREFPFLNLTCQVYGNEGCEIIDDPSLLVPLVEFQVSKGMVSVIVPGDPLFPVPEENCWNKQYNIYGDSIEIPWDLWAPTISALSRHKKISNERLGAIINEIMIHNRIFQKWRWVEDLMGWKEEMSILEDYAMSKGWLSKPPKVFNCWPIRKAAKEMKSRSLSI